MIELALIGYGKMGKMIESIAPKNEFHISGIYDVTNPVIDNLKENADVAIEFSTPSSVMENIEFLASKGVNIVCGTTGWYDKTGEVEKMIADYGTGFIYASNFSVGVNLFFKIVKDAARLMNGFSGYNVSVAETHHTQKLDKPSGTAIRTAEYIISELERKDCYTSDKIKPSPNEVNITSYRIENVVGKHEVDFDSESDTISLIHNAKSRRGFAEGALLAAKYIHNKKGFYRFEDVFENIK
jgi:4-hydroxy-tetrahydrodipicolinate reductase